MTSMANGQDEAYTQYREAGKEEGMRWAGKAPDYMLGLAVTIFETHDRTGGVAQGILGSNVFEPRYFVKAMSIYPSMKVDCDAYRRDQLYRADHEPFGRYASIRDSLSPEATAWLFGWREAVEECWRKARAVI